MNKFNGCKESSGIAGGCGSFCRADNYSSMNAISTSNWLTTPISLAGFWNYFPNLILRELIAAVGKFSAEVIRYFHIQLVSDDLFINTYVIIFLFALV